MRTLVVRDLSGARPTNFISVPEGVESDKALEAYQAELRRAGQSDAVAWQVLDGCIVDALTSPLLSSYVLG